MASKVKQFLVVIVRVKYLFKNKRDEKILLEYLMLTSILFPVENSFIHKAFFCTFLFSSLSIRLKSLSN